GENARVIGQRFERSNVIHAGDDRGGAEDFSFAEAHGFHSCAGIDDDEHDGHLRIDGFQEAEKGVYAFVFIESAVGDIGDGALEKFSVDAAGKIRQDVSGINAQGYRGEKYGIGGAGGEGLADLVAADV